MTSRIVGNQKSGAKNIFSDKNKTKQGQEEYINKNPLFTKNKEWC